MEKNVLAAVVSPHMANPRESALSGPRARLSSDFVGHEAIYSLFVFDICTTLHRSDYLSWLNNQEENRSPYQPDSPVQPYSTVQ